jgi:hypothetical protein
VRATLLRLLQPSAAVGFLASRNRCVSSIDSLIGHHTYKRRSTSASAPYPRPAWFGGRPTKSCDPFSLAQGVFCPPGVPSLLNATASPSQHPQTAGTPRVAQILLRASTNYCRDFWRLFNLRRAARVECTGRSGLPSRSGGGTFFRQYAFPDTSGPTYPDGGWRRVLGAGRRTMPASLRVYPGGILSA